ncbi:hypothetical protein M422DRAFT_58758 [Sphaerobolus stellatus SS14]|nr:hypothetical protein M422DRAFT_58758 [Sphaerobolus stellatus SS14]
MERVTDPSSGTIEIDGIDITTIGVHDLRLHITFVAQDAILFSGTISHGQRQLLTLARALLRRTSIIILDEATSSVDHATDAKIQKTIREECMSPVLLLAHRLSTIIDYDRLMVLDNGRIVEFDTPYNLIRRENGVFREMCFHSGQLGALQRAAEEAHNAKNQ